jgi:soluble cytochrome b562
MEKDDFLALYRLNRAPIAESIMFVLRPQIEKMVKDEVASKVNTNVYRFQEAFTDSAQFFDMIDDKLRQIIAEEGSFSMLREGMKAMIDELERLEAFVGERR